MTFGEKLTRLRKREGMSQEDLAAQMGISRQAVSRWEQGTAMPDSSNLLAVSRLFRVSADYLLYEELEQEDASAIHGQAEAGPKERRDWLRKLAGAIMLAVSALGLLLLGILSSVFPAAVSEAPAGIGLAGLAANIVLCLVYLLMINPRYMNRRFTKL